MHASVRMATGTEGKLGKLVVMGHLSNLLIMGIAKLYPSTTLRILKKNLCSCHNNPLFVG